MDICRHTRWLRLSRKDQSFVLEASDRAQRLLDYLPRPEEQAPSLITLVGNQSKLRALRELGISGTGPKGKRGHGEIHLFVSPSSQRADRPILIADGDMPLQNRLGRPWKPQLCHEISVRPFPGDVVSDKLVNIADHIYYRVLFPFTDAICFFATDLGGIERVVQHLAMWMDKGQPSTLEIRPWLIIAVDDGVEEEVLATFWDLVCTETTINIMDRFTGIRIISLAETTPRSKGRRGPWARLNRELLNVSQLARQVRLEVNCLFSARHLAGFLQHAAVCATEMPLEPFDFIRTSRCKNPVAPDLEMHLSRFMKHFQTFDALKRFAIPIIASCFILDHYPPEMHRFHPRDVFCTLYRETCSAACKSSVLAHEGSRYMILPSAFTSLVEEEMIKQFTQYASRGSSEALHRQLMASFQHEWANLRSDDTCFCCIRRRPQFGLPCGHSLCENCVRVFGRESPVDPWLFYIDACFLCQQVSDVRIRMKPDTASVRVLSIDGGGVRGRAPLEFIQVLQDCVGLPCPVQQHFDVIYGTSSGAIIAFALYANGWPIEDCIVCFESLARLAFQPRPSCRIPILAMVYEFLVSLLVDSRYPARNLESALQRVFGSTRSIIDCSKASEMGAMVGMPVTTIRDASACVFTNYNGVGQREESADYHVIQPEGGIRRIPLWEILRCGTAAPYYFKPRHIEGLGTFQDGGLMYNNPALLALAEVAALFKATPDPSLVVSLGTGSARADRPDVSRSRPLWQDSFPLRIFRAFWQYGNSKRAWNRLLSREKVGRTGEFFRFDIEFEGQEPPLDNVVDMKEISDIARETILGSPALDRLIHRIRAELFVFELDPRCPFRLVNGTYQCVGRILCRLRARTPEFVAFMSQLDQASASFLIGDRVLPGSFQDRSAKREDGNFFKEVRFHTPSRTEPITISLREGGAACPISGSPFTLQFLIEVQSLDARFGTADHRKRKWLNDGGNEVRRKRMCRR
ncbi:acyl transferase/acyl hydrolase/lysophospholipase [Diplogelasinospora grovesii]|uniref:Acyl transferase/acyl hydrolase/lysophospholipase n=1 Tax=Diplogelasinospora grovesii TaxID=303347 RepID=A0AAN6RY98_9PEZI|nr:acyl transferase/acyl hydrolase/lysophospholipase [Diplogelasinospora grovesii]